MRLLGLDYGAARIGVALSDPSGKIASPHSVLRHIGWGPSARAVAQLARENDCAYVVLGLPCRMNGREGAQAKEVRGFAEVLRKQGLRVEFQDERLTSREAEDALREGGVPIRQSKGLVDQVAAALILQAWLDRATSLVPPDGDPSI